jgi:two-component system CheB/CheR fusion protein
MSAASASRKAGKKARTPAQASLPVPAPAAGQTPDAPLLIVGIGASAGGLGAFEAFFSGMPTDADPGMAFVLVQHLAPDHKSVLSDLIRRCTRMPVFEVTDGMVVQPNCVYIIPPNRDMAFLSGALHLLEPTAPRGHRLSVDFFFRSLAQDQHDRAIGIVLSGTGSDGTHGVRAIKGEGGMVMAQLPASTEFDGMPASAIATGLVDFQLQPADMPVQLIAFARHAFGKAARPASAPVPPTESSLKKIFVVLRAQTGHDFSQYKPSTIVRRIERRMAVHQIDSMVGYVKYLQQTPTEGDALFCDLLIGVTSFFRDPEAFEALAQKIIPRLFEGKPAGATVRVWSAGCSTGEEAYSIAMLLQEHQDALKHNYTVQVFASDLDRRAIASARAGRYPASIAGDMSAQRLERFFTPTEDESGYCIHKSIRDMLVFSEHDLIKDPPFSRLDLVVCRNLLIYLDGDLQKKLLPFFHYALAPGRFLFLGNSETLGDCADLFAVVDGKAKLYQRKEDVHGVHRATLGRFLPPAVADATPQAGARPAMPQKRSLRELTEQALLHEVAPAAVLVNEQGDILYLHGHTGMFLELPSGDASINNILKMARDGLRRDLTTALRKAVSSHDVVQVLSPHLKNNGRITSVNCTIRPVLAGQNPEAATPLYLVVLEEAPAPPGTPTAAGTTHADGLASEADARIAALSEELRTTEGYLQAVNEELETANEELKSSNEELQSVNEELQSTNEELETSKEEMQSINEELTTVNTELQTKVVDLSHANNDMSNLLASTGIGTVFVDLKLCVLRYTPAATRIINLIPGDVGRPIAHTVTNLVNYRSLVQDLQNVLDTLVPRALDVQTQAGAYYTMRILPYRTLDNVIEGAVITFVDITEVVRTRERLQEASAMLRLAVVLRDAHDAITVQDLSGHILAWNPGAVRLYGWSEAEALHMNVAQRIPRDLQANALALVLQLSQAKVLQPCHTQRLTRQGEIIDISLTSTALVNEDGHMYAIATTERAIAPRNEAQGETP